MTRQQLFAAFFFAVFLFLLYQFYLMFSSFAGALAWAGLLAFVFYPLQMQLTMALKGREGLAAFLLSTFVLLIVMVPTVLLTLVLASESVAFYQRSVEFVSGPEWPQFIAYLQASTPGRLWTAGAGFVDSWDVDLKDIAVKATNTVSGFLVAQATDILKNVATVVLNFFMSSFALFFFFRDGERMVAAARDLLPMEPAHKDIILRRLHETISAVVLGTLATAAAQGAMAWVGYWTLGVPFALVLGCLTGFASLLPMGGPLVWVSAAIYLAITAGWIKTLILVLWGSLAVGGIDNVIRPLIIGGRTAIPTVVLFFGIFGGLQAYGLLGVFLAPVVIAILVAFVSIYREQYQTAG